MATYCYKNAYLMVGSSDISTYVKSATLNVEYDELEVTAMGAGAHNSVPGLQNWSIDVECNQSWTNAELDAILYPIVGAAAASAIVLKPNGSSTSTSNPKWTANGRVFSYNPIAGAVGDRASVSFTIKPGDGTAIARATSD